MANFTVPNKYINDYIADRSLRHKNSARRKYMNMVYMVEDEIMTEEDFEEFYGVHSGERVGGFVL